MLGLIRKDLYLLKHNLVMFAIMVGVFAFVWIPLGMEDSLIGMMTAIGCIQVITVVSYDERSKWDAFVLSMPVSRRMVVMERYLMMALCTLFGGGLGSAAVWILSATAHANAPEFLFTTAASISVILIWGCVFLPFLIKFGSERARLMMVLLFMVPTLLIVMASKVLGQYPGLSEKVVSFVGRLLHLSPALAVLWIVLSYFISLHFYNQKEF